MCRNKISTGIHAGLFVRRRALPWPVRSGLALALLLATPGGPVDPGAHLAHAAPAASCGIGVEITSGPFVAVDSNAPGVEGPKVVMLSARVSNDSGAAIEDVEVHLGNGTTPGVFPATGGNALAVLEAADATRGLGNLGAGEETTIYWPVTYPATYDQSYGYTAWASGPAGCTDAASTDVKTQSEISATANKLQPTGATITVSPDPVAPGETVDVTITGFDLGTIGAGPRPLSPRDAWLQPVGDDAFDPACLRLVRTETRLHSVHATAQVDALYFDGLLGYNADPADYVRYTFLALGSCTTDVVPYQQAASGTQEKYNGDFEEAATRLTVSASGTSPLTVDVTTDSPTALPGETIAVTTTLDTTGAAVGEQEAGSPVYATLTVPEGTTFVAGSAEATATGEIDYSTDGGATWSTTEPADPATVTDLRWVLEDAVSAQTEVGGFEVTVDTDGGSAPLGFEGDAGVQPGSALVSDTAWVNGSPPTPTPTPSPTPQPEVQGGETGGLESGPLEAPPSAFLGAAGTAASGSVKLSPADATPGTDVDPANDPAQTGGLAAGAGQAAPQALHKARLQDERSLRVADLLPDAGPAGSRGMPVTPVDVLAATEAPEAAAMDFVDGQGRVRAVALGVLSLDAPYEHDWAVCNRFKEYAVERIAPAAIAGLEPRDPSAEAWFWGARATAPEGGAEEALVLQVFVDETGRALHLDSRWLRDDYPADPGWDFDYVLSFQTWSADPVAARALVRGIVERLRTLPGGWSLQLHNRGPATAPELFVHRVRVEGDRVRLSLRNTGKDTVAAELHGTWRDQLARGTVREIAARELLVRPGDSELLLALPALLDAVIRLEHDGFLDKVYAGGGLWFAAGQAGDQGATPDGALQRGECRALEGVDPRDLLLAGCASVTNRTALAPDQAGLGRTLNPNGRPVDVSPYAAVRFFARGDGRPVRLMIETAGVTDGDYPQVVFTPTTDWREVLIPLSAFVQRGFGEPSAPTFTDVRALVWLNAESSTEGFRLEIDQPSLSRHGGPTVLEQPQDGPDTGDRALRVRAADPLRSLTVRYSLDGGRGFAERALQAEPGGDWVGLLPGQPLGTDVWWHLRAVGRNGYVSHAPIDAPSALFRYRVDDRASLLVDDFTAGGLHNRLGGTGGIFAAPPETAAVRAWRGERSLRLRLSAEEPTALAGWFTSLGTLDATAYTSIDLLLRVEEGARGLSLGLRDAAGFEPRLALGDAALGGMRDEWRWLSVPLAAFPEALDRDALRSLSLSLDGGGGADSARGGVVELREVRLGALPTALVVDAFDDGDDRANGRGLPHGTTAPGATLTTAHVPAAGPFGSHALRLDYAVPEGSYALWRSELGGLAAPADGALWLWWRDEGDLTPHIYLSDGTRRAFVAPENHIVAAGPGPWRRSRLPLAAFADQGIDTGRLQQLEAVLEFDAGEGTLWLDGITIGRDGAPRAGRRTIHLVAGDREPLALHLPGGGGWTASSSRSWLRALPVTGSGTTSLGLHVLPWLLSPGEHRARLTLLGEQGAPERVTVTLSVPETVAPPARIYLPLGMR